MPRGGLAWGVQGTVSTHRLHSSSCLGLPYKILNRNHKKELLRSLWVGGESGGFRYLAPELTFSCDKPLPEPLTHIMGYRVTYYMVIE